MGIFSTKGVILALFFLAVLCFIQNVQAEEAKSDGKKLEDVLREYDERKVKLFREKFCRNQDLVNRHKAYHRICPDFNRNYLKFFLSLFLIVAVGALTRTLLRAFELNIPYTVILMVLGLMIGLVSHNQNVCTVWTMYTRIARTPPKIILYVFLPVLIYESAFAMKAHVFYRSSTSIMILAFPGILICTFLTAFIGFQFFYAYKWEFIVACLFGSIISATDPVAVVAILKEIGTSETLSIMIEGESLLNDGAAILLYEIFMKIVAPSEHEVVNAGNIIATFCRIAIGGPVFGWVMARLSIFFLSRIFNDAPVEVSITLVAAYLTYFIGEAFLEVSGVMAVVALGLVMSAERTCISPEVQGLVHHFWEMLSYLANTVLFVMVGIVITETAINNVTLEDLYYLIFLYFGLNISRFLMIIALSPILSHVGYGLSWQNMLVMTWGGLRGAVGICLALEVFTNREICEKTLIGPKFLLQTAGITLLTLLINGTTTKLLLDTLKLTELSIGKIQDMGNAVRQIQGAQQRTIGVVKHDRLLADCDFDIVESYTNIENPYLKHKVKAKKTDTEKELEDDNPSILLDAQINRIAICPDCEGEVEAEPSLDEYRIMTEEARLRLLKAMKVSCWRQYEQGVLTEEAVQILVDYIENCEDKHFKTFHASDLKKHWAVHGCVAWMRNKLLPFTVNQMEEDDLPPRPTSCCRKRIYCIVTNDWFDGIVHILILASVIFIIWETVYIVTEHKFTYKEILAFLITNIIFTLLLLLEFIFKVVAFGCGGYWSSKWNILDALILIISLIEICLSLATLGKAEELTKNYASQQADHEFLKFLRFIRVLRLVRILRLFRPLVPRFMNYLNTRVNTLLFFGYDVAKGAATSIDDVVKFLPQMIDNQKVFRRFKTMLEDQRLVLLLEMGLLQKDHPGIAIAIKTRHANRAVLNQIRHSLNELKEDGLLDQKEYDILLHIIEIKMKGLWNTPSYMAPRRPEMVVADLQWVGGSTELLGYLLRQATILQFAAEDVLYSAGDDPNGLYLVVSGVVKINYLPDYSHITAREMTGVIANTDIFNDPTFQTEMTDYFTTGAVLGELGVLTGAKRASTVTCETGVTLYHLTQTTMQTALDSFDDRYDSLEGRLWRTVGMKLGASILPNDPAFQSWTIDKIRMHLEMSAVPVGDQYLTIAFPPFITDVVLIYGQVVNFEHPTEIFTAPCLIPSSVMKITPIENFEVRPRIMIIAAENMDTEGATDDDENPPSPSTTDIRKYMLNATKTASIDEKQVSKMNRPSVAVSFGVRRKSNTQGVERRLSRTAEMQSQSQPQTGASASNSGPTPGPGPSPSGGSGGDDRAP